MGTSTAPAPIQLKFTGAAPRLIAQVHEKINTVARTFPVKGADGNTWNLDFDEHLTSGTGGKLPFGYEVSKVEADLRQKILILPKTYDATPKSVMALNEFNAFLTKKSAPEIYTDPILDQRVASDDNFVAFSDYTLNAPGTSHYAPGRFRLHQALKTNGWDINIVTQLIGLGVLAFNAGYSFWPMNSIAGGDFTNGLTILIDTVAHALIFVKDYSYSSVRGKYDIELVFELYDGFGLNDANIERAGYCAQLVNRFAENEGFTAWWQLQHQFAYAPLVTKVSVTRSFSGISAI